MKYSEENPTICVLTREDFFRPNEEIYIHMSNERPDYVGVLHKHEFIEMVYILSGSAVHQIGDQKSRVKRGDLFIINMDTVHAFFADSDTQEPFVAYDLMFTPQFFDQSIIGNHALEALNSSFMFYSLFGGKQDFHPYFSVSGSSYTMFGELFNKIYLEHRGQEKGYLEIIRAYLLQLIITIFRMEDSSSKHTGSSRNRQAVDYILNYIQENYARPISIQELADRVYLSRDYLGRFFREVTGYTIGAMIQKVRIEHVCHLLSSTDRTISDIASACGFEDMKFFYTVFKKHMGILPGDYRTHTRSHTNGTI